MLDLEKTSTIIINWIKEQAEKAHAKSLIVGISGGIDSALVASLAKKTGLPVYGVIMPCHSSSWAEERGREVISTLGINQVKINLEKCFESIYSQVEIDDQLKNTPNAAGALRSCLRSPALDFVGKVYNGIILGTGNKDEDYIIRYFQKRGDGNVDVSPIADLHKSEVFQMARYLGVPQSVLDAKPSADLWGGVAQYDEDELGISYGEIEWVSRLCDEHKVPARGEEIMKLAAHVTNERELTVLVKVAAMEIATRHKENPNTPVCKLS